MFLVLEDRSFAKSCFVLSAFMLSLFFARDLEQLSVGSALFQTLGLPKRAPF